MGDWDDIADRIATIADEAFGPFPVQSAEENMTAIERGIFKLRQERDLALRDRDELRARVERMELSATERDALETARDVCADSDILEWGTGEENAYDFRGRALAVLDRLLDAADRSKP